MPTKIPKFSELFGTGELVQLHAGDKSLDFFLFFSSYLTSSHPGTYSDLLSRP